MLRCMFVLYVPGTHGDKVDAEMQESVRDVVVRAFCRMFGGCTVTEGQGNWIGGSGEVITERVLLCKSFCTTQQAFEHKISVLQLARDVCEQMRQEAVSLEINGELHLITAKVEEAQEVAVAA